MEHMNLIFSLGTSINSPGTSQSNRFSCEKEDDGGQEVVKFFRETLQRILTERGITTQEDESCTVNR